MFFPTWKTLLATHMITFSFTIFLLVYRSAFMEGILSMGAELKNQPGGIYDSRIAHPDGFPPPQR